LRDDWKRLRAEVSYTLTLNVRGNRR